MKRTQEFQTIHSEGGLLPPDLLRRVLDPKERIPGTSPADYGLPPGERVNEAVTQSWNRLRRHWAEFRGAAKNLPQGEPATGLTNDKWSVPLLRELGFGMLPATPGPEINGRTYAINRFFGATAIHLIGCGLSLDRRAAGVRGAAAANPHGLVQDFLNRSDGHLWAVLSNGLRLRVLRDNQALSRQSYLEFDLEAMFDGEVFSDFVLLWLMAHATRFAACEEGKPETCWLEQWTKIAAEQGTRALESLRGGVEKALQVLGQGFVGHPRNTALREALRSGELSPADFHGQLLRVVYRLIFLFVAEDRTLDGVPLLHTPAPDPADAPSSPSTPFATRYSPFAPSSPSSPSSPSTPFATRYSLFAHHYSTARLRDLASRIKGSRHGDLWQQFNLLVGALSGEERFAAAREQLAIPVLGSFLWSPDSTGVLNAASLTGGNGTELANADFLEALRNLAFTRQNKMLQPVDYKNLGSEEFGGVYESFLALTPQISGDGARFTFAEFAGNERKTSGSYYTPDTLVQCLLDSALDPVVEERLGEAERMANGEWRMVTDPYRREFMAYARERLSGAGNLAKGAGHRQGGLSSDQDLSQGGAVRDDLADSAGGDIDSRQHSRGMGQALSGRIHPIPADSQRKPDGTGDASDGLRGRGAVHGGGHPVPPGGDRDSRPATAGAGTQPQGENGRPIAHGEGNPESGIPVLEETQLEALWAATPFATRHSLFAPAGILSLKVCDPAVGSGHFLVGAAHRLARHLARVRAHAQGEGEPSPTLYQHALRDVIGRCLYGVDINPMAVELCKVSLWLEALEPGKPLSFLDHHIQCGNSLLGATPELVEQGLPDAAFTPIEGDEKAYCAKYKKRNKEERGTGQMSLDEAMPWERLGNLAQAVYDLDTLADDTPGAVRRKQERYEELVRSAGYLHGRLLADAWCAAFVWKKRPDPELPFPITESILRRIERNPHWAPDWLKNEIQRLARQYQFFHWHLAFPEVFPPAGSQGVRSQEVGSRGRGAGPSSPSQPAPSLPHSLTPFSQGFDIILGNPPWERVKLQEKEWFAERSPEIASAPNAAARKRMIEELKTADPALHRAFREDARRAEGESHLMRNSGRYPLCGRGDINTYAIFAEAMNSLPSDRGRVGAVLPTGIATDDTTKLFFQYIVDGKWLVCLYDFENRMGLFPDVQGNMKFCLLTLSSTPVEGFVISAQLNDPKQLQNPLQKYRLTKTDICAVNPNTRNCPMFRFASDALLVSAIHRRHGILFAEEKHGEVNPWQIAFSTMFHMTNDSMHFRTLEDFNKTHNGDLESVNQPSRREHFPLYEAKLVHHYNHRAATFEGIGQSDRFKIHAGTSASTSDNLSDPNWTPLPRFWITSQELQQRCDGTTHYLLGFRNAISATADSRSLVATIIPRAGVGNSLPLISTNHGVAASAALVAIMNSIALDYVLRQKAGGGNLNFYIMKQLPFIGLEKTLNEAVWESATVSVSDWLLPRILELTYTAWDLELFARDCGWSCPPFRWDEDRRFLLRCELDAAFFHLYLGSEANGEWRMAKKEDGCPYDETPEQLAELQAHFPTPRHAVDYILDTFPIVRRKDEAAHGEYRTKRVILEIYDAMQQAIATGTPYQTRLDPPPADPSCCHPGKE